MTVIKNSEDLRKLRDKLKNKSGLGNPEKPEEKDCVRIKIAMATCSIASGSKDTFEFIMNELEKRNINAVVSQTGCMGYCYAEPTIEVKLPGIGPVVFGDVNERRADEIIEKYIKNGELVDGIIPENYHPID